LASSAIPLSLSLPPLSLSWSIEVLRLRVFFCAPQRLGSVGVPILISYEFEEQWFQMGVQDAHPDVS
jgi:hypothetical protein